MQGAIMVASCIQILVGFSGLIGFLMRFLGPLTIAPTISLVALPLFDSVGNDAGIHWGISVACARLVGAPPPPKHAINRGIGIEGLGCLLAGAWGTGNGTTSFSENVGALGITKFCTSSYIRVLPFWPRLDHSDKGEVGMSQLAHCSQASFRKHLTGAVETRM
uniref:Solute carrier family 23 member 1-like n=1 Tax=Ictidomys tridecemlineatus TaxID=43179 RepID=A0A287DCT8_ICTTR